MDSVFSFLRIVLNRSVVNDTTTQSLRALSSLPSAPFIVVTKYDQFRGITLMKPSQQSVSAQPVLLFNPRLTAGSPYTPSTRKLGKEYTKDELELMRLELAKDLEKEEAAPLSEDPAAVEQRREEELRAFAGSGAEAGEEEHEPELVDFEALEKGLALPPDMEAYARSCEKQRDDAPAPPAPPALPVRLGRQGEQPREPEPCEQPEQQYDQPEQPKQAEQLEQPKQAEQPEQPEQTKQQQQEDPLSELVPALCDPVASFRLMERLVELEERLKDRPARDKPLPSFMRPTRTAPASNAASPKLPTAKGAKKSPASPPPARFESRFANRHAQAQATQATQATQTAQHTPAVMPRRNMTPRPAPKPAPKPEPKSTYAPPPVRSRLYLPSVYHAATLPATMSAAMSATMSAARPGKKEMAPTRRSFSPLMRAKTPSEEFAPLEVRTANPRSKLPLPMVLRYPMLQSLSTRNSLAGTVEERREVEVGARRGREA